MDTSFITEKDIMHMQLNRSKVWCLYGRFKGVSCQCKFVIDFSDTSTRSHPNQGILSPTYTWF